VKLTVTDNVGATGALSKVVIVRKGGGLALAATGSDKLRVGRQPVVSVAVGSSKLLDLGWSWDKIKNDGPYEIAHRGLANDNPEFSVEAFADAAAFGFHALEASLQKSADGTWWLCHDATVDRTTNGSGTISAMTDKALAQLKIDVPAGASGTMMTFQHYMELYGDDYVIFVEDKTYANQAALVALLQTYPDATKRFVWKQDGTGTPFAGAVAAGFKTWGYFFDSGMAGSFPSKQAAWSLVGLDYNSSDATLSSAISTAGASRCILHILPDATQRARAITLGCAGVMVTAHAAAIRQDPPLKAINRPVMDFIVSPGSQLASNGFVDGRLTSAPPFGTGNTYTIQRRNPDSLTSAWTDLVTTNPTGNTFHGAYGAMTGLAGSLLEVRVKVTNSLGTFFGDIARFLVA
jgi:hypothetical protein